MKRVSVVISLFLLLLSGSNVMADTRNLYVGGLAGGVFPRHLELTDKAGIASSIADQSLDNGFAFGARIGYILPLRFLAIEAEWNYIKDMNASEQYAFTYSGLDINLQGNLKANTAMANLLLRYPEGEYHPYMGAGIGVAWFDYSGVRTSANILGLHLISVPGSDSANAFAYQFLAGIQGDISQQLSWNLQYKYLHSEPKFDIFELDTKFSAHLVTVGLSWHF